MRYLFVMLLALAQISVHAQRGDNFRHALSVDLVGAAQGVGNLKYEFFDAPNRGITVHVLSNFTDNDFPISGAVSRRFYFANSRWSAFVAPYVSYMQVGGTYVPKVTNDDGELEKGDESRYKSRSTNAGLSIGYTYLGMGGFVATAEFGYGYALVFNADWLGEPPTKSTESTLKAIVPLIFNLTVGYAF